MLLAIALYYALWAGEYTALDLWRIARRQQNETQLLAVSRQEHDSLERVVELLEDDPATIEAVARERFGMIGDGELLYRFVEVENDSTEAQPQP